MTVWRSSVRAPLVLAATCLLVGIGVGCGVRSPHAARSTSPAPASAAPTAAPSSSTSVTAAGAQAMAVTEAYQGMWADVVSAARTADYRSPSLAAHTVDPATGQLRRTLLTYSQLGVVVKGILVTHPRMTSLDLHAGQATVADCLDDTRWLTYAAKTGQLTDNRPGSRKVTDATVRRVVGQWRVSSYVIHADQPC